MKPTAYVLNLDRRPDRWQRTQELWFPYFDLVRCSAVDLPDGARGCKLSHCQYAAGALAKDAMAIVLEDDAVPTRGCSEIGLKCIEEARTHLSDWDFIMGGAFLDLSPIRMPKAELTATDSPLFLRSSYGHNTHFMLYNHRSLPILQASLSSPLPVDIFIGRNAHDLWVPKELLARQDFSPSDIRVPFPNQHKLYDLSEQMLIENAAMSRL